MIHKLRWSSLLLDLGGDRVEVRPLPLSKRRRFIELQTFLGQLIEAHPDLSIGYFYDRDPDFEWAIDESLMLFGLSADQLSGGQVAQLLFAYDGGPGALWQLEFPEADEVPGRLLNPKSDPYHSAIAAVWSYSPDKTLAEVVDSIAEVPWADIEGILSERNRMAIEASPELRAQEAKRKQQEALRRELENLAPDDFFDGLDPYNQPALI